MNFIKVFDNDYINLDHIIRIQFSRYDKGNVKNEKATYLTLTTDVIGSAPIEQVVLNDQIEKIKEFLDKAGSVSIV